MSNASTKRVRFHPYAFQEGALDLNIKTVRLDGHPTLEPAEGERSFNLGDEWRTAQLEIQCRVGADLLARVLPSDEGCSPRAVLLVTCRCPSTYLLRPHIVAIADALDRPHTLEIEISADDVANEVSIHLDLVRTHRASLSCSAEFAKNPGMGLSTAQPWTLLLRPPEARGGRYLDVQFASFMEDERVPRGHRDGFFYLEERDPPILLLNRDHPQLYRALRSRGTRGPDARTRDLALDQLQEQVWPAIITRALEDLERFGETSQSWQDGVLKQWLPDLYPDAENAAEQRDHARHEFADEPMAFMKRLGAHFHARSKAGILFEKMLTEVM